MGRKEKVWRGQLALDIAGKVQAALGRGAGMAGPGLGAINTAPTHEDIVPPEGVSDLCGSGLVTPHL